MSIAASPLHCGVNANQTEWLTELWQVGTGSFGSGVAKAVFIVVVEPHDAGCAAAQKSLFTARAAPAVRINVKHAKKPVDQIRTA